MVVFEQSMVDQVLQENRLAAVKVQQFESILKQKAALWVVLNAGILNDGPGLNLCLVVVGLNDDMERYTDFIMLFSQFFNRINQDAAGTHIRNGGFNGGLALPGADPDGDPGFDAHFVTHRKGPDGMRIGQVEVGKRGEADTLDGGFEREGFKP